MVVDGGYTASPGFPNLLKRAADCKYHDFTSLISHIVNLIHCAELN